ncbi:MAG: RNA polymerase sigma factor [Chloroflexota bacterium]|nr:RNA polymerase sigma factor [Chloroflexota bacterium]
MEHGDRDLPILLATDVHRYFKYVVESYQHRLYTFARRLIGSPQDAEDIVQEAFVRAYVSLVTYPKMRVQTLKLQPWLYKITLHEFHHHVRGARLHVIPIDLSDDSPVLSIEDTDDERPEIIIESQEQLQELEALVARLPDHYRIAVMCYYFEHLNYQEIAELLDQPIGTVKSTIFRGVRLLRAMLHLQKQEGREEYLWNTRIPRDKKA